MRDVIVEKWWRGKVKKAAKQFEVKLDQEEHIKERRKS